MFRKYLITENGIEKEVDLATYEQHEGEKRIQLGPCAWEYPDGEVIDLARFMLPLRYL